MERLYARGAPTAPAANYLEPH